MKGVQAAVFTENQPAELEEQAIHVVLPVIFALRIQIQQLQTLLHVILDGVQAVIQEFSQTVLQNTIMIIVGNCVQILTCGQLTVEQWNLGLAI